MGARMATNRESLGARARGARVLFALWAAVTCVLQVRAPAQEAAPGARAYFYLETYSARFECLVPMAGMLRLLGEPQAATLSPDAQQRVREAALGKVPGWLRVRIDRTDAAAGQVFRASVVKGAPGRTELLQPGEIVTTAGSMLGLVWEFDLPPEPERIEFAWNAFSEIIPSVAVSIIAGSQSEEHLLTLTAPSHRWENRGRVGLRTPLAAVPPLPTMGKFHLPIGSLVWVLLGLFFMGRQLRKGRRIPGRLLMTLMSILFGAAVLWPVAHVEFIPPWAGTSRVAPNQAERILAPLLRNVYRAFDQREEGAIYDVLARSIEGELLQKVYLQTIGALTLDAQDATRVRVRDLPGIPNPSVTVSSVRMLPGSRGFIAETQWMFTGSVGHWGHQHDRTNRYTAGVTVEAVPTGGGKTNPTFAWKITGLEILEERRM